MTPGLGPARRGLKWCWPGSFSRPWSTSPDSAPTSAVASLSVELSVNLFGFAAVVALLAAPLMAMRMLSREFRDGSFDLIGAAPVRLVVVVLGKFLARSALITPGPAAGRQLADARRQRRAGPRTARRRHPGAVAGRPDVLRRRTLSLQSVRTARAAVLAAFGILSASPSSAAPRTWRPRDWPCSAGWPGTSICSGSCSGRSAPERPGLFRALHRPLPGSDHRRLAQPAAAEDSQMQTIAAVESDERPGNR